ncbi:MAG: alpha/beta hydrolase [Bacteroidales bacterium]|nr:alpha/beta hydrolase [Bacteroidales bacterium]
MTKSILEDRTISKRFLFPREKHFKDPFLVTTSTHQLSCFKQIKHQGAKMLLVFHASNEIVHDYIENFAHEIDKMGFNLFIAEYPGYALSTGSPSLINIIEDIPFIIKNCGIPTNQLVVFGRSIGTSYAINAVSQFPEIKGLIIESGIADYYERLERRVSAEDVEVTEDELKKEVLNFFNIEQQLKAYKGATLILHTKDDKIIDVKHAKKNYEWANEPKEIILFEDGRHSDIQFSNSKAYFEAINNFMDKI